MHLFIAQLTVAQAADRVIFIKTLLRLGGGLDVPLDHLQPKAFGHLPCQFGLAGARLAFDQQRALQCHSRVHGNGQIIGGDIGVSALEFHGKEAFLGTFPQDDKHFRKWVQCGQNVIIQCGKV